VPLSKQPVESCSGATERGAADERRTWSLDRQRVRFQVTWLDLGALRCAPLGTGCHAPASVSMLVRDMSAEPSQTASVDARLIAASTPMQEETELLAALRTGDADAFRLVVDRYHLGMIRLVQQYVPRPIGRRGLCPGSLAWRTPRTRPVRSAFIAQNLDLQHRTQLRACAGSAR
jgi:hypothetical protein